MNKARISSAPRSVLPVYVVYECGYTAIQYFQPLELLQRYPLSGYEQLYAIAAGLARAESINSQKPNSIQFAGRLSVWATK